MNNAFRALTARSAMVLFLVVAADSSGNAKTVLTQDYTVPAGAVEKEVTVNLGDLTVLGTVTGSAKVANGDAAIRGEVGEDLFVTLGDASVEGRVGGEIVVKSGDLTLSGEAGKDVTVALGDAIISGKVKGTVSLRNGDLILRGGTIDGDVEIALGDATLEGGSITGSMAVRGGQVQGNIGIVQGGVSIGFPEVGDSLESVAKRLESFALPERMPPWLFGFVLLAMFSLVFFVIAFGLVMAMLYLFRIRIAGAGRLLTRREIFLTFLSGLGGGLVIAAATGILAVTFVFIPIALFLVSLAIVGLIFGFAVLSVTFGRSVFADFLKWRLPGWLSTLLGFLLLLGLLMVPPINAIAIIAYLVLSLGVTLRVVFGRRENTAPVPRPRAVSASEPDGETLTAGDAQRGNPAL
jgi:hypothetical protein